jgi:uncharacterized protein (DUF488 family)
VKTIVYTWGYSKHGLEDLCSLLREHGITHVIDVRARPMSRIWRWRHGALEDEFGPAYIWAECFGNPDGRTPDNWTPPNIKLGPFRGYLSDALREVIGSGMLGNVLLLCLEHDPAKCHRSAVADFIGLETVHLGWPGVQG